MRPNDQLIDLLDLLAPASPWPHPLAARQSNTTCRLSSLMSSRPIWRITALGAWSERTTPAEREARLGSGNRAFRRGRRNAGNQNLTILLRSPSRRAGTVQKIVI